MAIYKPIPKLSEKAQAKFWSMVERVPDGCWLWTGPKPVGGYGRFRERRAHRVAYVLIHGEPGESLTLDHLCRNRACVNPAHLQPITNKENILRGSSFSAVNAAKTHCLRGHLLTPDNLMKHNASRGTRRTCLKCNAEKKRARYRSKKEKNHDMR